VTAERAGDCVERCEDDDTAADRAGVERCEEDDMVADRAGDCVSFVC
jgi:hypothetical protein